MTATILVVDDEENTRVYLESFLTQNGYEVIGVETLKSAREYIRQGAADIVLLDVQLPDGYGPVLLDETAHIPNPPPIIVITGFGDIKMAVEVMNNGAFYFLEKPINFDSLKIAMDRAIGIVAMRRELDHLRNARSQQFDFVIGKNQKMRELLDLAKRVANSSVSVLITGETGTGKEVLTNAIYKMGPRADKPFVDIHCAAIQPTVLESELFGYEPGAFTGADKRKSGLMETANEGILFLDEISSMPLDIQIKLLRAIGERYFRRVGGTNNIKVDVQVIAASNRDLPAMIKNGEFREDLYYRLKVVNLHLPPLRKRKEDIPELAGLFIQKNNLRMGMNINDITPRAMKALINYDWPGNIRELKNAIEHSMLFCDDAAIDISHLPAEITANGDHKQ
jgi:two-component system, NtrC family, response regulator AtoC